MRCHSFSWFVAALALVACRPLLAQGAAPGLESIPLTARLGFEQLRLPGGEAMGLVGGTLLFDIDGQWSVGPAVYGAATGQRGGFFVGGVELQRRWAIAQGLAATAGLYAGGGGGAAAPVGSGLMLRPSLTLLKDVGRSSQVGLSWSSVRFPSGQIGSNQLGLVVAWRGSFISYGDPANATPDAVAGGQASGLGFDRVSPTVTEYRFSDRGGRRFGLAGVRAERRSTPGGLRWGFEAAAAAQGDAAGYMELLGTVAASIAPLPTAWPAWRVGTRVSLGLGGGGAVPTGGGVLGKAAATTELELAPGWSLAADVGALRAGSHGHAAFAQVSLGVDLEPDGDRRRRSGGAPVRTEWVGVLQHHAQEPRADGTRRSLETIGLKIDRYFGDHFYLSGQAHSAYAGGAGAFSVGLLGAGAATDAAAPLRLGAEVLLGAAGGGGVATSGGGRAQALVWGGWRSSPDGEWRAGVGKTQSLHGATGSPLVELSWSRRFGMSGS